MSLVSPEVLVQYVTLGERVFFLVQMLEPERVGRKKDEHSLTHLKIMEDFLERQNNFLSEDSRSSRRESILSMETTTYRFLTPD